VRSAANAIALWVSAEHKTARVRRTIEVLAVNPLTA